MELPIEIIRIQLAVATLAWHKSVQRSVKLLGSWQITQDQDVISAKVYEFTYIYLWRVTIVFKSEQASHKVTSPVQRERGLNCVEQLLHSCSFKENSKLHV